MRRVAPRHLSVALRAALPKTQPAGLLAAVQAAWPGVAGELLAGSAAPVSEHDGVITVDCESSVWAQELELLGPDLAERLNAAVSAGQVARLRFVVGSAPKRS